MNAIHPRNLFDLISLPAKLAAQPGISPGAKLCYAVLLKHARNKSYSWPQAKTIADALGVDQKQVRRYWIELEKGGWLKRVLRSGTSSHLVFTQPPNVKPDHFGPLDVSDQTPGLKRPGVYPDPSTERKDKKFSLLVGNSNTRRSVTTGSGGPDQNDDEPKALAQASGSDFREHIDRQPAFARPSPQNQRGVVQQLTELMRTVPERDYDPKAVSQIARILAKRGFTVDQFCSDVQPHVQRLLKSGKRTGVAFYIHHAQVFDPTPAPEPEKPVPAVLPPACAACLDRGVIGEVSGFSTEILVPAVESGRAQFCTCASGRMFAELCSDHITPSKGVRSHAAKRATASHRGV